VSWVCECGHAAIQHRGACRADDSYGITCSCPGFEAAPDDDKPASDELDDIDTNLQLRHEVHHSQTGSRQTDNYGSN
jgi:hypothetical protein